MSKGLELSKGDLVILNEWMDKYRDLMSSCEICQQKRWSIDNNVYFDISSTAISFSGQLVIFPHLIMICSTCGNTRTISAKIIGLKDIDMKGGGNG